jgi:TRAP-type transport system periplasmic protein
MRWIGLTALAAVAALGLADARAQTVELKYALFTPPSNFINKEAVRWAEEIKQKSGGKLTLALFHSSQMGPPARHYDLARTGVSDISYILQGFTPGRFPLTELVQLPGLMPTGKAGSQAMQELLPEFLGKEYVGVRVLYLFGAASVPIFSKRPVRTLADVKGMRIRYPDPMHQLLLEALGATPVSISPIDVPESLNKGTIDGVVMGYSGATAFQLQQVAKFSTEFESGGIPFAIVMNPGSYDKLPADMRKLIDDTTGAPVAARMGEAFDEDEASGRKIVAAAGVEVLQLAPADAARVTGEIAAKLTDEAVKAAEAKGAPARAFLAAYKERLKKYGAK